MKILMLGFAKIKYMPYLNFYLDNIDKREHQVHVLYWNRDLQEENLDKFKDCTLHEFKLYQEDEVHKTKKIKSFCKYRQFAKRIINEQNFDFIFILHSLPGILTSDILLKRYKGQYVFDYRDSTYESFKPYKNLIGKISKHSKATFVSSNGFRKFFPDDCQRKIFTSHNLLVDSLNHREIEKVDTKPNKIRIAFWGMCRNEKINKSLIDKISNDNRFELHYYGREQQLALNLKKYVHDIGANNVFFHGEYKPEDRYDFASKTDLIHNLYDDNNMMLAMANKYYDGIIFKIPQLCMEGSFMAKSIADAMVGLPCDPNESDFTNKVYEYYVSLNKSQFDNNCDKELSRILIEYNDSIEKIKQLLENGSCNN
jgi:hypothetical protein